MSGKLTATRVRALKAPGRYQDGDGLMLEVKKSGSRSWVARLQVDGKRRDFGLGSAKDVDLGEARELARQFRAKLRAGIDPTALRRSKGVTAVPTFKQVAEEYHAEAKRGWSNGKHVAQWINTLRTYAYPLIGMLPVDQVETGNVRDVLAPIWLVKPETAGRVRQRIQSVLEYAHAKNWRTASFPMDAVNRSLPKQTKRHGRFAAVPVKEVQSFMALLRERDTVSRVALEACILTATRSGEIRGAVWSEIDLERKIWTIPAKRMKAGKKHTVALSAAAVDTFRRAEQYRRGDSDHVFPGLGKGKTLSDGTLRKMMRDLGRNETVHGFRSTFRDWVADETDVPGEVAEAALAHAVRNPVEAAYRRTDHLKKRRGLMDLWGRFCASGKKHPR